MSTIQLKIDGKEISVPEKTTVLEAAEGIGIEIPTLCHLKGKKPFTSCMVCLVKDNFSGKLIPACSATVEEGIEIITGSEDVLEARKAALELLLSEHLGDCEAQCRMICPAYMNIPEMIRQIGSGNTDLALDTIRKNIPLSKTISLICPAPCEKGCRRKRHDNTIAIKNLEKYAAFNGKIMETEIPSSNGKKVAVIGSGPAGISVAYFLILKGYKCVVFEKEKQLGGMLRDIEEDLLPSEILDEEIGFIRDMGCEFRTKEKIELVDIKKLEELKKEYDAVVITTGENGETPEAFESKEWLFVSGNAISKNKNAIKAIGDGRIISEKIEGFIFPDKVKPEPINSRFGPLQHGDMEEFLKIASSDDLVKPENNDKGFSEKEAEKEASRCLHCDCGKVDDCRLREFSTEYRTDLKYYKGIKNDGKRSAKFTRNIDGDIIYEPGKCIKCGICVRICAEFAEKSGMTFTGRGYDTEIKIPFGKPLSEGLGKAADESVKKCPTGALAKLDISN